MKLLLTDLDGTLEPAGAPLSPCTREILDDLLARGVEIIVVTGAATRELRDRGMVGAGNGFGRSVRFFTNNGGASFTLRPDGSMDPHHDHGPEYAPYRRLVTRQAADVVLRVTGSRALYDLPPGEGGLGPFPAIEQKESQTTVRLFGHPHARPAIIERMTAGLASAAGRGVLSVREAGSKSIDVSLSKSTKACAVHGIVSELRRLRVLPLEDIVIAGDSFGPNGADQAFLHPAFSGGTVLCAGADVPSAAGFRVRAARAASPASLRALMRERYGLGPAGRES
jgi:hypothetical protein